MTLKDKRALVTGAAKGIGKGIARRLAESGAYVILADILTDTLEATTRELAYIGLNIKAVFMDLSKAGETAEVVSSLVSDGNSIDILVNNAGTISWNSTLDLTEAEWDLVFDVNAKGVFFLSQAVAKTMVS